VPQTIVSTEGGRLLMLYQPAMILTPSGDSQASESLNLWRP
jgi:hypothetical protein